MARFAYPELPLFRFYGNSSEHLREVWANIHEHALSNSPTVENRVSTHYSVEDTLLEYVLEHPTLEDDVIQHSDSIEVNVALLSQFLNEYVQVSPSKEITFNVEVESYREFLDTFDLDPEFHGLSGIKTGPMHHVFVPKEVYAQVRSYNWGAHLPQVEQAMQAYYPTIEAFRRKAGDGVILPVTRNRN
tara:strand:+ start:150 stop:713 length:564 start_codon:yes stop_codon:yes gene_type:complete